MKQKRGGWEKRKETYCSFSNRFKLETCFEPQKNLQYLNNTSKEHQNEPTDVMSLFKIGREKLAGKFGVVGKLKSVCDGLKLEGKVLGVGVFSISPIVASCFISEPS